MLLLSLLSVPTWAAISLGTFVCAAQSTSATKSVTVTITINNGDTVDLGWAAADVADTVSSITGGNTFTQVGTYNTGTSFAQGEFRTSIGGGASAASVTVNWGANSAKGVACVGTSTGGAAWGNQTINAGHSCSTCSIAITTQDNNNFTFSYFGRAGTGAYTQSVGTLQAQAATTASGAISLAIVTNTQGGVGSLTSTVTNGSATDFEIGEELRSTTVAPTGHNSTLPLMGIGF